MSRTYVALDLETTGLNPDRDAIIEIGAVKFRGEEELGTWSTLVDPDRPLPYYIQQLTGITPEDLDGAPSLFSVLEPLQDFVNGHPVVGHSIGFDLSFLNRHGLFHNNLPVDTFELATILVPHASRHNLGTLVRHLGIELPEQHRALADAISSKDLFLALRERALQLTPALIQEINRLAANSDWPLKLVFQDIERSQARSAFSGSIGQQLAAKRSVEDEPLGLLFSSLDDEESLRPVAQPRPLDVEMLADALAEEGTIARNFPGYEYRPQQVRMLEAVAEAFNRGENLLVEAGTGTGKSLAYLLPAVQYAATNGRPVVVSTNTINLQDQLFQKDIPDLRDALGLDFRATVLKGRTNYLCRRRLDLMRRRSDLSEDEIRVLAKILAWLPTTRTGDQAELMLMREEWSIWRKVCADAERCPLQMCASSFGERCFFYRARTQGESAHIIIVNHALLLSDMATNNRVLPEYHHLIIDEAHHLEDRATDQLGFEVTAGRLYGLLTALGQSAGDGRHGGFLAELTATLRASSLPSALQDEVQDFVDELHREIERARSHTHSFFEILSMFLDGYRENRGSYDERIRLTSGLRVQPAWQDVQFAWENLSLNFLKIGQRLERLYRDIVDLEDIEIPDQEDLVTELGGFAFRVNEIRDQLDAIIDEPSSNGIYWATVDAQDSEISLHAAPLHVGELLREPLFANKETVVLTSATLQTEGDFDYVRGRLGLDGARELLVGSPFDYASSTLLYLPTDIPEPGRPYYQKTVEAVLTDLCKAIEGRTLVLFTSYSQLRNTYQAINQPLGEEDISVIGQGMDGPRHHLLKTLKEGERTVLLGTRSFWEGVDVVGEALSCLVIARLPFSVPSDPVFAARSETFENSFSQYAVPQAVLRFRQGFGRLIRSKTDRGVVVLLDKRVLTKSYGSAFLDSLPHCTVHRGAAQDLPPAAVAWINEETQYQRGMTF